jgi:putative peptidoglycan lipid II flippase
MMAGLMVLSEPLVSLIYGGGEFGAFSVFITSRALRYISLGMVGFACRPFYAAHILPNRTAASPRRRPDFHSDQYCFVRRPLLSATT